MVWVKPDGIVLVFLSQKVLDYFTCYFVGRDWIVDKDHWSSSEHFLLGTSIGERFLSMHPQYVYIYLFICCMHVLLY